MSRGDTKFTKIYLTNSSVNKISPPVSVGDKHIQKWIYDSKTPKLAICVWSSGNRSWYWVGRLKRGKMFRYKLGSYPDIDSVSAKRLAKKVSFLVASGIDPRKQKVLEVPKQPKKALTYALTDGAYLKIGCTIKSIKTRVSSLQTGNPNTLYHIATTQEPEKKIHRRLNSYRVKGEWFKIVLPTLQDLFEWDWFYLPVELTYNIKGCLEEEARKKRIRERVGPIKQFYI